jgi:AcrR family transcriptional regulator
VQRRAKGHEREQRILDAAIALITESGLADLRMADVAKRAGIGVGHVTYYFPSRSRLLVRAIQERERRFQLDVEQSLASEDDPWGRLQALVEAAAADGPDDRDWLLWFEVWSHAANDHEVSEVQRTLDGWWRTMLRAIVDDGIGGGDFECSDPTAAVDVLSALTDGLSVQLALGGDTTRRRVVELVIDTAHRLLDADPSTMPR